MVWRWTLLLRAVKGLAERNGEIGGGQIELLKKLFGMRNEIICII